MGEGCNPILKRRVLNDSVSLDEDRSESGDNLSLVNLITKDALSADDEIVKNEVFAVRRDWLLSKLSKLEQEVFKLYLMQYHYDQIVAELRPLFPGKRITKKTIDNSLVRVRQKAQGLIEGKDFDEI